MSTRYAHFCYSFFFKLKAKAACHRLCRRNTQSNARATSGPGDHLALRTLGPATEIGVSVFEPPQRMAVPDASQLQLLIEMLVPSILGEREEVEGRDDQHSGLA